MVCNHVWVMGEAPQYVCSLCACVGEKNPKNGLMIAKKNKGHVHYPAGGVNLPGGRNTWVGTRYRSE